MEFSVFKRDCTKKGENKKIRLKDGIPAVIYGKEKKNENIYINRAEFEALIRKTPKGHLSTVVLNLKGVGKVIIKEIQYHRTSYDIIHVDFAVLGDKPVKINIPVEVVGVDDCAGIKLGGILRRVIRSVRVRCLPKDMPKEFVLDVSGLSIGGYKKLADIKMPANITPLVGLGEVAVVIAKR